MKTRRQKAKKVQKEDVPPPNESPIVRPIQKEISSGSTSNEPLNSTPKKQILQCNIPKRKVHRKTEQTTTKPAQREVLGAIVDDLVEDADDVSTVICYLFLISFMKTCLSFRLEEIQLLSIKET